MELFLMNTAQGLKPLYDEDYDEKKKLKIGQIYRAKVTVPRNLAFHRKYFSLINCAWDLQSEERQDKLFHNNKEAFRRCVQVCAGYFEKVYNVRLKDWVEIPRSIAFDKMSGDEFDELYKNVRDVLFKLFLRHISEAQFDELLINY